MKEPKVAVFLLTIGRAPEKSEEGHKGALCVRSVYDRRVMLRLLSKWCSEVREALNISSGVSDSSDSETAELGTS